MLSKSLHFTILGFYVALTGCNFAETTVSSDTDSDSDLLGGWSDFSPSPDSRVIYVSSSTGIDTNNGLSPETPVRSILAGVSLMRNTYPDYLLLKRGDRFEETGLRGIHGSWDLSGRSASEKMVISSYGEGSDPQLTCPEDPCMRIWGRRHLAVVGLDFYLARRDPEAPEYDTSMGPSKAVEIRYDVEDLLFEGNKFRFFRIIDIDKADGGVRPKNIRFYRNIVLDFYSVGGLTQGLFAESTDGLILEENIFDHNGWLPLAGKAPSQYDHNIYLSNVLNTVMRRNIFSRGSSMGVKVRTDFDRGVRNILVEDNLFLQNHIGLSLGGNIPSSGVMYVNATLRGNIFTENGRNTPISLNWALTVGGSEHLMIEDNYFVHNPYPQDPKAIDLANLPMTNVIVKNNRIHNFSFVGIHNHATSGVTFNSNYIEGLSESLQFLDQERSISSYNATLGYEYSSDDYLQRIRQQTYRQWSTELFVSSAINYMKQGFIVVQP